RAGADIKQGKLSQTGISNQHVERIEHDAPPAEKAVDAAQVGEAPRYVRIHAFAKIKQLFDVNSFGSEHHISILSARQPPDHAHPGKSAIVIDFTLLHPYPMIEIMPRAGSANRSSPRMTACARAVSGLMPLVNNRHAMSSSSDTLASGGAAISR